MSGCLVAFLVLLIAAVLFFYLAFQSGEPVDLLTGVDKDVDGIILFHPVSGDDGWRAFIRTDENDSLFTSFLKRRFRSVLPHGVAVYYCVDGEEICRVAAVNPNRFSPLFKLAVFPSYLKTVLPDLDKMYEATSSRDLVFAGDCKEQLHAIQDNLDHPSRSLPAGWKVLPGTEISVFVNNQRDLLGKAPFFREYFSLTSVERSEIRNVRALVDVEDENRFTASLIVECRSEIAGKLLTPRLKMKLDKKISRWERERGVKLFTRWRTEGRTILLDVTGESLQKILYGS